MKSLTMILFLALITACGHGNSLTEEQKKSCSIDLSIDSSLSDLSKKTGWYYVTMTGAIPVDCVRALRAESEGHLAPELTINGVESGLSYKTVQFALAAAEYDVPESLENSSGDLFALDLSSFGEKPEFAKAKGSTKTEDTLVAEYDFKRSLSLPFADLDTLSGAEEGKKASVTIMIQGTKAPESGRLNLKFVD